MKKYVRNVEKRKEIAIRPSFESIEETRRGAQTGSGPRGMNRGINPIKCDTCKKAIVKGNLNIIESDNTNVKC